MIKYTAIYTAATLCISSCATQKVVWQPGTKVGDVVKTKRVSYVSKDNKPHFLEPDQPPFNQDYLRKVPAGTKIKITSNSVHRVKYFLPNCYGDFLTYKASYPVSLGLFLKLHEQNDVVKIYLDPAYFEINE